MGQVIFAVYTQVFNDVYGHLKDQMKLDLCISEPLSCMLGTKESAFVVAINYYYYQLS